MSCGLPIFTGIAFLFIHIKNHIIMKDDIKYEVSVQVAQNTMTPENPNDRIFRVASRGAADKERIIQEMMLVNPGLEKETLSMVLDLKNRVCQRLLMLGMRVNDGYCNAALTCRGVVDGSAWDPEVNSLAVNMQPAKELREAVAGATVTVTGTVSEAMYVSAAGDAMTKAPSYTVVPGSIYRVEGKNVKVEGDDPSVGIFFVDEDGTETQVPMGQVAVNNPSELRFIVPSTLTDGTYTLRIVTQFANSGTHLLKTPRSAECTVYIGDAAPEGGGTSGGDDEDSGQGTFG